MTNPTNKRLEDILAALPGTTLEVAAKAGVHRNTAQRWLALLSKPDHPDRCVFVKAWKRSPGKYSPVYDRGTFPNKPCRLVPLSQAECTRRWRAKARREGRLELILKRRAAVVSAKRRNYMKDPLLAWLYKPAPTLEQRT